MRTAPHDLDVTRLLGELAASRQLDDLDPQVIDRTKRIVLDTVGCMALGSTLPPGEMIAGYVRSFGGAPEAGLAGHDVRLPAPLAALANGVAAHGDELDGVHKLSAHPAAISVAACLATSEADAASGADLLLGITISFDIGCGLLAGFGGGLLMKRAPRHLHASSFIAVGAGAGCARIGGASPAEIRSAMALAATQTFVPDAFLLESTHMSKALAQGQAAAAGVSGARLARAGCATHDAFLDAPDGLADAWWHDQADLGAGLSSAQHHAHVLDHGFKYFSAGYAVQAPIALTLRCMADHGISPEQLSGVRVGVTTSSAQKVDASIVQGVSLQDMLSIAIARGGLTHEDAHDPTHASNPLIRSLRERIEVVRDQHLDEQDPRSRAAWVEVTTTDGASHRTETELPPGHGELGGMPWEDLRAKFRGLAGGRLRPAAVDRIIDAVEHLDDLGEATELGELLGAGA